ncbi:NAD(+)/NADH kinase [Halopiger goleimassiliensis]|uniref:NAD(+)/NADH kinase n=1 Tax=Halopiger goleimassiliensis TaxID=1293048 RepID=UPI000678081A|nr:NAD(+)/NADH kinase [Halopiger goleimassiliensis]
MEDGVGIVAQRDNERAQSLAETIATRLEREHGVVPVVDEATGEAIDVQGVPVAAMADRALVVSIGGDGTLLFVAREVGDTPILGVNLGEVGFLNAVAPADATDVVADVVGRLEESESLPGRELARLQARDPDGAWALDPALNEVLVHGPRRGPGGGATIEVDVDGETYTAAHTDGVLVATPTGSTAYNLSEGGPLIRPGTDALVITGMAPAESMPPLIVDQAAAITLTVTDAPSGYAISDGRNRKPLEPPATVEIGLADDPVRLVGPQTTFFEALEKLE